MRNICPMPILVAGLLMSGIGLADDQAQTELTPAAEAFIADLERSSRWQPLEYVQPTSYTDDMLRPLPGVEFVDGGLLERLSSLRRVSFLTFAEFGQAQLFFGVNDKGLLGFHFNAFRGGKERQLEMLRMPYLLSDEDELE